MTKAELQNLIVQTSETALRLASDRARKVSSQTELTSSSRSTSDSEKELSCSSHERGPVRRKHRKRVFIVKASNSSIVPSSRVDTRTITSRISALAGTQDA
jgi:hypothetical protein